MSEPQVYEDSACDNLERPVKRPRLTDVEVSDEDLFAKREKNDQKLKSRFENIFEKYGKSFEGIGDEIDLETGQVIIDNGHLSNMSNERDAGDFSEWDDEGNDSFGDSDGEDWSDERGMLTSSLLSQFQKRIKASNALSNGSSSLRGGDQPQHADDKDSLMGDPEPDFDVGSSSVDLVKQSSEEDLQQGATSGKGENKLPSQVYSLPRDYSWALSPRKQVSIDKQPMEASWISPQLPGDRGGDPSPTSPSSGVGEDLRRSEELFGVGDGEDHNEREYHPLHIPQMDGKIEAEAEASERSMDTPAPSLSGSSVENSSSQAQLNENGIRPRSAWSKDDDAKLLQLKLSAGLKYDEMLSHFPGRTETSLMRRWHRLRLKEDTNPNTPKAPMSDSKLIAHGGKNHPTGRTKPVKKAKYLKNRRSIPQSQDARSGEVSTLESTPYASSETSGRHITDLMSPDRPILGKDENMHIETERMRTNLEVTSHGHPTSWPKASPERGLQFAEQSSNPSLPWPRMNSYIQEGSLIVVPSPPAPEASTFEFPIARKPRSPFTIANNQDPSSHSSIAAVQNATPVDSSPRPSSTRRNMPPHVDSSDDELCAASLPPKSRK